MHTGSALDRSKSVRTLGRGLSALVVTVLFLGLVPATAQATTEATTQATAQAAAQAKRAGTVRGTLASLPPIVQPGASAAAPQDTGSLIATFAPAHPGGRVTLERKTSRGWKVEATAVEDAWGSAAFSPRRGTYRARTTSSGRTWTTGTVTTDRWTPEFEDTFSGASLDSSVWNDQRREHESVYAPRTCARVDAAARRVQGGVLHLGVADDPARAGMPCQYTSNGVAGTSRYLLNSQVATEYTRSFRHGIVAARIKPQRAKGMHSGFWLLPSGTTYVDGAPALGTEIDVMEFFGENGRGTEAIGSHVHYYEANWKKVSLGDYFPSTRRSLGKGRSWWDEFHVFSVEWTDREYVFRVDGREYYREAKAVSQVPQYLVLSNLTSDYELDELTADELGDTAQVDWVRVFDATSHQASKVSVGRTAH
ncbi:glycoside hydrolase family 16 protein [Nocardioides sp. S-58]|uniref:Glycoside hydrolase family 16 protein n=1 Tax=Nocardioides renjunii TaxID=3095075 RepID=A0ABU5K787_9ACTN|nr:glycoside hydrolase family 16 protein [Nocardioides sp. S-58]MDZ5660709.1 glycoside hydrolase family 16 protein [Nocardioides sp. S-58]